MIADGTDFGSVVGTVGVEEAAGTEEEAVAVDMKEVAEEERMKAVEVVEHTLVVVEHVIDCHLADSVEVEHLKIDLNLLLKSFHQLLWTVDVQE